MSATINRTGGAWQQYSEVSLTHPLVPEARCSGCVQCLVSQLGMFRVQCNPREERNHCLLVPRPAGKLWC